MAKLADGGRTSSRARRFGALSCLSLVFALLLSMTPNAQAQGQSDYRYPAGFFCGTSAAATTDDSSLARDTLITIANTHPAELAIEITFRGDQSVTVDRSIPARSRVVVDCADVPTNNWRAGFVDIASPKTVDVVALYQTTVTQFPTRARPGNGYSLDEMSSAETPTNVLVSVTFHVQLERKLTSEIERQALTDLGFMVGKPVPLMVMTHASPDALLTPADDARHALWQQIAGRLIESGMGSAEAGEAAHRIIGDAMVMWVEVDDTDIALGDIEVSTDIVHIVAESARDTTTQVTPNPVVATPAPCATCAIPPVNEIGPINVELISPPGSRLVLGWLGWLGVASAVAVGALGTLLLGLLGWLLTRWLRRLGPPEPRPNPNPEPKPPPNPQPTPPPAPPVTEPPVTERPPNPGPPPTYPPPAPPVTEPPVTQPPPTYPPPNPEPPPTYPPPGRGEDPRYLVSCGLRGEREIDVDDRQADLEITVEIIAARASFERAEQARLTLTFDFTNERIAFNGNDHGTLEFELPDLVPNQPVSQTIAVSTGVFSNDSLQRPSADPGRYVFYATVTSRPVPADYCSAPITQTDELHFFVADD